MHIGTGIAIAGIWLGVGICSFNVGSSSMDNMTFSACIASAAIAFFAQRS